MRRDNLIESELHGAIVFLMNNELSLWLLSFRSGK